MHVSFAIKDKLLFIFRVMLFECREGFKLERLVTLPVCKSRLTLISLSPDTSTIAAVSSTTVYIITERRQQEVTDNTEWTISGKFKVCLLPDA